MTNRKNVFCIVLAIIMMLLVSACSSEPVYYSKQEVKQYVSENFGADYKLIEEKSYPDDTDEQNLMYEYVFSNKDTTFSVFTSTYHPNFDATTSIFYSKVISDNYIDSVVQAKLPQIQKICESASFNTEISENNYVYFHLDNYKQIPEAAELLCQIDEALAFSYDYTYPHRNVSSWSISLYLEPNEPAKVGDSNLIFGNITMSHSSSEQLIPSDVTEQLQWQLANKIKDKGATYWTLPDEILYRYPASYIRITKINEHTDFEFPFTFYYDNDMQTYWMGSLDPCQDFEEFPYVYFSKGTFAQLVQLLGGTYTCDNWTASWQIGEDKWTAELITGEKHAYEDLIVKKNGQKLVLSPPSKYTNGTVSGRCYTPDDLECMLDVIIELDQKSMTGVMTSKPN